VPNAEIHFLTKSNYADVLAGNPYIDKLHTIAENPNEVYQELKKNNFDAIIDLHHNQRSWTVKRKLASPSYSFHKLNIEKWLLVNFKWNRLPERHIVDRYFDTVSHLSVQNDNKGLDFFIRPEALGILEKLPACHKGKYVAFVIGAKHATKRLPEDKIINLCKEIKSPVILIGGPEDKERGDRISSAAGDHVYSACGKCSLHESAALVKNADHVITHDTGLMHIAAAFQKSIISVWGNTIPKFGMYPYYNLENGGTDQGLKTVVEVRGLSCRPCSKIGFEKCPKGHLDCLNKIDETEILKRVNG
jgi:ADP-heptose:LPS heptosyltransferase